MNTPREANARPAATNSTTFRRPPMSHERAPTTDLRVGAATSAPSSSAPLSAGPEAGATSTTSLRS